MARRGRGRAAGDGLDALVRTCAKRVLEQSWNEAAGYCRPNRRSYPHLWLWDSCFHAIAWFALDDPRGLRELEAIFKGQLASGFVPHMRYGRRTYLRGPLPDVSSFTQPPVYARALKVAMQAGFTPAPALLDAASRALDALWSDRMRDGLLVIVHPWEAGTDDSPRWDSWVGSTSWNRRDWTRFDRALLSTTVFADDGRAIDNPDFVAAPAAFNAIAADAAMTLGELIGDPAWLDRGRALAKALDDAAWNSDEQLWSDIAVVGGGPSVHVPTLDAALPALCTTDLAKASTALAQLRDPERFGAPSGPRFVVRDHPTYRPDQYWRGPAWPQLNYLAVLAARQIGDSDLADQLAGLTKRGCVRSGFAEYWNPETGRGLGARPQTWSAIAAAV
ncbi:MAG: hypothetical protein QOJ62_285 [Actinomycetota bacterium]|nr:hypothetical protein [Actinomycetota bacterium]